MSTSNPYAAPSISPARKGGYGPDYTAPDQQVQTQPTPAEPVEEAIPNGSAKELMDWVGEDTDRAKRAEAAEHKREHVRTTVLANLKKIAADG